ncbi:SRPBCC family protein [Streptomyces sp. NPDC020917]|uniref:SRPBCC family protein n=1 Tax=Streptomyces sp. NPDC020917 TaxID=3365102 RepID=UPI0037B96A5C
MPLFEIERVSPLPPAEAWRRMTAWERHTATVPLTTMTVRTPPPSGPGTVIVARTGVGPLGFDDPMRVTVWQPGRHCRLEKTGRLVTGWAEIDVRPDRDGGPGSLVSWREDLRVRGVPRVLDAVTASAGRVIFGRAMDALLKP